MNKESQYEILEGLLSLEKCALEIRETVNNLEVQTRRMKTDDATFQNQFEIDVIADQIVFDNMNGFNGYILSEERQVDKKELESKSRVLVVDPIDGSTNASRGIGYWSFSAAVLYEGKVEAGIVVDQVTGRVFKATSFTNPTVTYASGETLEISQKDSHNLDFGSKANNFSNALIIYNTHDGPSIPFRHLRNLGSSALAICEVALGSADAYIDDEDILLKPWDLLAAEFIADRAGCCVKRRDSEGKMAATGVLVTRSSSLEKEFKKIFPNFFH